MYTPEIFYTNKLWLNKKINKMFIVKFSTQTTMSTEFHISIYLSHIFIYQNHWLSHVSLHITLQRPFPWKFTDSTGVKNNGYKINKI